MTAQEFKDILMSKGVKEDDIFLYHMCLSKTEDYKEIVLFENRYENDSDLFICVAGNKYEKDGYSYFRFAIQVNLVPNDLGKYNVWVYEYGNKNPIEYDNTSLANFIQDAYNNLINKVY